MCQEVCLGVDLHIWGWNSGKSQGQGNWGHGGGEPGRSSGDCPLAAWSPCLLPLHKQRIDLLQMAKRRQHQGTCQVCSWAG